MRGGGSFGSTFGLGRSVYEVVEFGLSDTASEKSKTTSTAVRNVFQILRSMTSLQPAALVGVEAREVQGILDEQPEKMRQRRETVEHPFSTIKARMGATHFLMKRLPRVASEMALHVLAYNMTKVMSIMGVRPLMAAMRA